MAGSRSRQLPGTHGRDRRTGGLPGRVTRWGRFAAAAVGSGLLVATASIHLYLYLDGYRTIPVIGWLFLLQVVTGFVLAAAVLTTAGRFTAGRVTAARVAAALGAGFAASTLGGYLLAIWFGLFGFKEVFTIAGLVAGVLDVAGFALLGSLSILPATSAPGPDRTHKADRAGPAAGGRVGAAFGPRVRMQAVASASAVALAVLAGALTSAATSSSPKAAGAAVTLQVRRIAGSPVLTDPAGSTLYWFAPDKPRASHCYGTCAAHWPPVIGRPRPGPGVTGTLGTLQRRGGAVQATYDHHPLYTYVGDSAPGQANGNGIFLDGGLWHEMTVGG